MCGVTSKQIFDCSSFFPEFDLGRLHAFTAEIANGQVLYNFVLAATATYWV